MQVVTIAGNIGRDAEVRTTQGGDKVTGWTVAVEWRSGKEKVTTWWQCSLWGARGDNLAQYLRKGGKVTVSGAMEIGEYEGKAQFKLRVSEVTLMGDAKGGRDDRQDDPQRRDASRQASRDDMSDDVPF